MFQKKLIIFLSILFINISCSKEEAVNTLPESQDQAFNLYNEALAEMERGYIFIAAKKFGDAELIMPTLEDSAKASIMSSFCYYQVRAYEEAINNLETFLKKYPASKYIEYANYLIIISYYEQILDEKKDRQPLILTKVKIREFLEKFNDSDYALDVKFKLDLINNQLAAKEMYVAKYYIQTKKWIPAINRLKNIIENYETTIFVEEALFRLVEINYSIGLIDESKKYASILGYNYNSSEWFKFSYKILNKDYKEELVKIENKSENKGIIKSTIDKILNRE